MVDPLTEVVSLLQPGARFSKIASGAGAWTVRRSEAGQPFYCVILEGACRLEADGHAPITLERDDFVLIPSAHGFTMSGLESPTPGGNAPSTVTLLPGETRHGRPGGPAEVRLLVGYCGFASPDAALLVTLLPELVHVRGQARLATLVQLVVDESREQRPAREVVLARLLEVLFIEALRSGAGSASSPGLARGLADARVAVALRHMHESPTRPWTVALLAKEAALSRSTFFERFSRAVGMAPMAYLLAWRMAMAKQLLRARQAGIAEVAQRVGYSSASTFNVAFTRHVGLPPGRYLREQLDAAGP
ncbi:MAG TPA: AraC family transcriptional regulator [Ideonella sp.]|uniref:AraC family transcriptional regulator n=1 Tax=Ideonella sp. TaxID=1929293 RepID=UPI002C5B6D66|nr:AraC family transcriptional regulator [Ideonella sp.]HSI48543.1 AraC family transcriptional regulator [Ideonella sp.]